ncbi:hypothetical protein Tco_0269140 [Tanacetum coccineum]
MEIGTTDVEAVADLRIGDEVGAHTEDGIGMGVEITARIKEDEEEFEAEANAGGTMEIAVDPLVTGGISESTRGYAPDLEGTLYDIVHYMSEVPLDKITEFETAQRQLEAVTEDRFESHQNGNGGNRNGNHRDRGNNRNGNPNENDRGAMPVARVCTYQDFVKCQPLNFKGTAGVVGLTKWIEKMETVFHISNCPEVYQVKYATCSLLDSALTW